MLFWMCLIGAVLGLAVIIYLGLTVIAARLDVSHAPREEMFICDIHGPMSIKKTIILFEDLEVQYTDGTSQREPLRSCPICFEEKIRLALQKEKTRKN